MGTKVGKMDVFIPFVLDGSGGWVRRGRGQGGEDRWGLAAGVIAQFFTIKPCNLHKQRPILCLFLLSFRVITLAAAVPLLSRCFRFEAQVDEKTEEKKCQNKT